MSSIPIDISGNWKTPPSGIADKRDLKASSIEKMDFPPQT